MEMMDISPLPHKLPATSSLICESQVESPVLMDDTESNASSEKTEDESASIEPSLPQPTTAELPRPLAAE